MKKKDVGIIIPAYNEEKNLRDTLRTLNMLNLFEDILVVDDGSSDGTWKVVVEEGAQLIKLDKNMGKGYALRRGVEYLKNPLLVFLDADVGATASEVTKLITPIVENKADVTIGKISFAPGGGGIGMVKWLSQTGFTALTGLKCDCILSGQRAFKRDVLDTDFLNYKRFGIEFGMTVDLVQNNLRILEVPVDMYHRVTRRDWKGFKHRGQQFYHILMVILRKKIKLV